MQKYKCKTTTSSTEAEATTVGCTDSGYKPHCQQGSCTCPLGYSHSPTNCDGDSSSTTGYCIR